MTVATVSPSRRAYVVATVQQRVVTPLSLLRELLKRIDGAAYGASDVRLMRRCIQRVVGAYLFSRALFTKFDSDSVVVIIRSINGQLGDHLYEMCAADHGAYDRIKRHLRVY